MVTQFANPRRQVPLRTGIVTEPSTVLLLRSDWTDLYRLEGIDGGVVAANVPLGLALSPGQDHLGAGSTIIGP